MKKVIIASQNPVKIDATKEAFEITFPNPPFEFVGISANSEVSDQPMTSEETLLGARNRIKNAKFAVPDADYYVGLEGGLEMIEGKLESCAWMVVSDNTGREGKGRTASIPLPTEVNRLIVEEGMELAHADDQVFSRTNSKHSEGLAGILTDGYITRKAYYLPALLFALVPFKKPEFFT